MAADGTMARYCDVLSGYHDGDALPFSVYRADDRANLKGTLNGKAIEPGFAFAVALGGGASGPGQDWETRSTHLRGNLSVDAPPEWDDLETTRGSSTTRGSGAGMYVAPSVAAFLNGFRAPGAFVAASATIAETPLADVLDFYRPRFHQELDQVHLDRPQRVQRGGYDGIFDLWEGCGGSKTRFLSIAAKKSDGSHIVYIQFQAPKPADLAILDRMLVTLKFDPVAAPDGPGQTPPVAGALATAGAQPSGPHRKSAPLSPPRAISSGWASCHACWSTDRRSSAG